MLCVVCQPKLAQAEMTVVGVIMTRQAATDPDKPIPPSVPEDSALRYEAGQQLANNALLNIPECAELILYNGTRFLRLWGPYKGPLDAYEDKGIHACDVYFGQTPQERDTIYDAFFRKVCQANGVCDTTCSAVFKRVSKKGEMTLKCP